MGGQEKTSLKRKCPKKMPNEKKRKTKRLKGKSGKEKSTSNYKNIFRIFNILINNTNFVTDLSAKLIPVFIPVNIDYDSENLKANIPKLDEILKMLGSNFDLFGGLAKLNKTQVIIDGILI